MKSPKKFETLEVRLSHQDKIALQKKAASEGRTVSDVVRGLISSYISPNDARSNSSFYMELVQMIKFKPKSVFATLACLPLFASLFFIPTTASAEDIALSLQGEFIGTVVENGEDGKRVRRFNTEIHIKPDHYMTMRMPSLLVQGPKTGLYMAVHVTEAEDRVTLAMTICEVADAPQIAANTVKMIPMDICNKANILAKPTLTTQYGDKVEFRIGDMAGETFKISAKPKRL